LKSLVGGMWTPVGKLRLREVYQGLRPPAIAATEAANASNAGKRIFH
jgi:hypothetical protein